MFKGKVENGEDEEFPFEIVFAGKIPCETEKEAERKLKELGETIDKIQKVEQMDKSIGYYKGLLQGVNVGIAQIIQETNNKTANKIHDLIKKESGLNER